MLHDEHDATIRTSEPTSQNVVYAKFTEFCARRIAHAGRDKTARRNPARRWA